MIFLLSFGTGRLELRNQESFVPLVFGLESGLLAL